MEKTETCKLHFDGVVGKGIGYDIEGKNEDLVNMIVGVMIKEEGIAWLINTSHEIFVNTMKKMEEEDAIQKSK